MNTIQTQITIAAHQARLSFMENTNRDKVVDFTINTYIGAVGIKVMPRKKNKIHHPMNRRMGYFHIVPVSFFTLEGEKITRKNLFELAKMKDFKNSQISR